MAGDPSTDGGEADHSDGAQTAAPTTFMAKVSQAFFKPPKPKAPEQPQEPERPLTDAEKKAKVNQIDPTERKIGLGGAALAAVIGLFTFVPYIDNPRSAPHPTSSVIKGHTCASGYTYQKVSGRYTCVDLNAHYAAAHWVPDLVIVLLFALAVFVTVRIGRRAPLAFALLMTGFALEAVVQTVLAIPFVFAGGWLVVRAWRVQKYGSPTASAARRKAAAGGSNTTSTGKGGSGAAAGGTTARPSKPAKPTGRPASGRRSKKTAEVVGANGRPKPTASKRYTPKAPPRKRVPPPE